MTFPPSDSGLFPLLKRVSRSFYLSIRFLPSRIRPAIAIGYLLARASDTIADTNKFEPRYRLETLDAVLTALYGPTIDLAQRVSLCVDAQPQGAEKELLKQLMSLVAYARSLVPSHQVLVQDVLGKIVQGQRLDIERFEMADSRHALRNADELEEYTYLVAGSVGEFWTRLCALEWSSYSRIAKSELERLGTEFGKGLQLVNILRDFPTDIANGRSYLPVDDAHRLKENVGICLCGSSCSGSFCLRIAGADRGSDAMPTRWIRRDRCEDRPARSLLAHDSLIHRRIGSIRGQADRVEVWTYRPGKIALRLTSRKSHANTARR